MDGDVFIEHDLHTYSTTYASKQVSQMTAQSLKIKGTSHIPLDLSRKAEKGIQMGPQLTVKESPPYPVNITAELGRISSTPVSIRQLK